MITGQPNAATSGSFSIEVTDQGAANAKTTSPVYAWAVGTVDDNAIWTNVAEIQLNGAYASYHEGTTVCRNMLNDGAITPYPNCSTIERNVSGVEGGSPFFRFTNPQPLSGINMRITGYSDLSVETH